jgi:hypothetical protein
VQPHVVSAGRPGAPDDRRGGPVTGTNMVGRQYYSDQFRGGAHAARGAEPLHERSENIVQNARFIYSSENQSVDEMKNVEKIYSKNTRKTVEF